MPPPTLSLAALNGGDEAQFVAAVAPLFEGAPTWVARAWAARPFADAEALHDALTQVMLSATPDEQVALIAAHPDLVGRAALAGTLTPHSQGEQGAAGLDRLSVEEVATFTRLNAAYRERFAFPFVICARENKKESIVAAFHARLSGSRDEEIRVALGQVAMIARLRLLDTIGPEEGG